MVMVSHVSFRSNSEVKKDSKNEHVKEKFPITYKKYSETKLVQNISSSVIAGGLGALVLRKGFNVSQKSSIYGGVITGACILISGIHKSMNGYDKLQYLKEKRKFEKN